MSAILGALIWVGQQIAGFFGSLVSSGAGIVGSVGA
jgi:hypothetical protein